MSREVRESFRTREGELAPITSIELRVTTGMVDGSASDGDLAGQRGG